MLIKILVPNRYNDAGNTAVDCKAGAILETGNAYGTLLVEKGLAEYYVEPGAPEPEAEPKAKKKAVKRTGTKLAQEQPRKNPNPFLG